MKTTITFNIEIGYNLPQYVNRKEATDAKDMDILKAAHLDDSIKKVLNSTCRANFSVTIKLKNETPLELATEIENLTESTEIYDVVSLGRQIQNYFVKITKPVFPELKMENDMIIDKDWYNKIKFKKNLFLYNTIMYNTVLLPEHEEDLLSLLQIIIDKKLEKYFTLSAHFFCWGYYFNNQPVTNIKEFINHRREQLAK